MKSNLYKVLHPVCGKPMVQHVVDQVSQLGLTNCNSCWTWCGKSESTCLEMKAEFALQAEQLEQLMQ